MDTKDKDKKEPEQDDKGFTVHDKRRVGKEDAGPDEPKPEPETTGQTPPSDERTQEPPREKRGASGAEHEYVPLTFTSFIMSLSTSALIYLGQVPNPASGETKKDLVGARQTIDLISLLKEKTKGNLTPDEEAFLDAALYDLRMLFVKAGQ